MSQLGGMLIANSSRVLDVGITSRSTRELTLDETLGVLGDRPTLKLVALPRLVALTSNVPPLKAPARSVLGSRKRTRRMRAYRFKALSPEQLSAAPVEAKPAAEKIERDDERPFERPREGIATVKIDRIAVRRKALRRRAFVAALTMIVALLAWFTALS